jgi:hypothetical protein
MLEIDPSTRCGIQSLVDDIRISNFGSDVSDSFSGLCCNGGYIIAESVISSHYEASTIVPNQRVADSVARSSAGTIRSAEEEALVHYFMTGQSLHSGRLDGEPTTELSKTTLSEKRNKVSGAQSDQKPTETQHREVETARYADWAPDINDERSRAESRYGARRDQSIGGATSTYDIEASSPTLGCLPEIKEVDQVSGTNSSLLSSNADRRSHISRNSLINNPKLLATVEEAIERLILPDLNALKEENRTSSSRRRRRKHEETHVQTDSDQHKPFMLEPPIADDERTVKEVIYQWLTNFDPSTYRKVMTVDTVEYPNVPMYRLGEKRWEPKLSSFTEVINKSRLLASTRIALQRKSPGTTSYRCTSSVSILGVWKDVCHVLDSIHVPYFGNEDHIVCVYPRGILPTYDRNDTGRNKGLGSFELLNMRRYETLQWWHDCLTSPQDTWTKKLRSVRLFKLEISGTNESLNFDFWELAPLSSKKGLTQIPANRHPSKMSNTYRHICSALSHSCFLLFKSYCVQGRYRWTYN